jgi:hypothetical protein
MKPTNGFSVSRDGMHLRGATKSQAIDWAAIGGGNATVFDHEGRPIVQIIVVGGEK